MARRTKEEAMVTRTALLDAAEQEFSRRGVGNTTLCDIASAAGVTRGALYHHFADKRNLVVEMMDRAMSPVKELRRSPGTFPSEPLLQMVHKRCHKLLHLVSTDQHARDTMTIIMHKCELVDDNAAIYKHHQHLRRMGYIEMIDDVRHAIERGELPSHLNPKQVALGLFSIIEGLVYMWLSDPTLFDLLVDGEAVVNDYLASLLPRDR